MPERTTETVLRTTVLFGRDETPAFRAAPKTTFAVTRAVLEHVVGGRTMLFVYGYRMEKLSYYAGFDQPGNEPKFAAYDTASYVPPELHGMLRDMEARDAV